MKLKSLGVNDFRALRGPDNSIVFAGSDIIFLFGKNNTGKSTFLLAYEFFVSRSTKATKEDFHNLDSSTPIEIQAVFSVDRAGDKKDKALSSNDPKWIDKWVTDENEVIIRKRWTENSLIVSKLWETARSRRVVPRHNPSSYKHYFELFLSFWSARRERIMLVERMPLHTGVSSLNRGLLNEGSNSVLRGAVRAGLHR